MPRSFPPAAALLGVLFAALAVGCNQESTQGKEGAPGTGAGAGMPSTLPGPMTATDSLRTEYTNLQRQLNGLQQQVMQDSTLQADYDALKTFVDAKMAAADPQFEAHRDRLGALPQEMAAAKDAGDNDKLQALITEGNELQAQLQKLQQETMALEEVKAKMDAFRDEMLAKMTKIDPKAKDMIDRANAISEQLQAQAAAPPPASEPEASTEPSEN